VNHPATAAHLPGPLNSCSELPRAASAVTAVSTAPPASAAAALSTRGGRERAENTQRAARAAQALAAYAAIVDSPEAEPGEAAEHLLGDLMHLFDALGQSFPAALAAAGAHHRHERCPEADDRVEPSLAPAFEQATSQTGRAPSAPLAVPLRLVDPAVVDTTPEPLQAPAQPGELRSQVEVMDGPRRVGVVEVHTSSALHGELAQQPQLIASIAAESVTFRVGERRFDAEELQRWWQ